MHDALLEARSSFLAQKGKEIPFPKEDPIIGGFPTHIEKAEGNNAVISRVDLAPHAKGGGALAPTRGILASWQGGPQDLIHGGPSTINEQHDCVALQLEGGREEEQHQVMRGTHPSLFQRANAKRRKNVLCCESKGNISQPYVQSTLDINVSLHRGIPLRGHLIYH